MKELITAAMVAAMLSGGVADGNPVQRMMDTARNPITAYSQSGSTTFGWSGPSQAHPVRFGW